MLKMRRRAIKSTYYVLCLLYTLGPVVIIAAVDERDPFVSPVDIQMSKEKDIEAVTLQGIVWNEKTPLAIINGEVIGAGESVAGFLVKTIEENAVHLEFEGRTFSLQTKEEKI